MGAMLLCDVAADNEGIQIREEKNTHIVITNTSPSVLCVASFCSVLELRIPELAYTILPSGSRPLGT